MNEQDFINLHPAERQRLFYDALGLIMPAEDEDE